MTIRIARATRILLSAVCISLLPAWAQDAPTKKEKPKYAVKRAAGQSEKRVTSAVVQLFLEGHFSNPRLTDGRSSDLFDEYFEALDPNKVYFLSKDIEEFSPYRLILDDMLRQGSLDFPFLVYKRFLTRVEDRIEYARERLKKPFGFDREETVALDRSKKPWAGSVDELDEIWRLRIKNQMLIQKMIREAAKKKREEATKEGKKPKNGNGSWLEKRGAEESVLRRYQNYLQLLQNNDTYDVMENFLTVFTGIFDPHSSYMNWRSLEDFDIDMRLSLDGIGAVLTSSDGYTQVVRVIPGGPVDKDDRIKPGDRIIAVGQAGKESVDTLNMPLHKVVRMIRGKKGTKVRLTVLKSLDGIPKTVVITRDNVKLEDSAARGEIKKINGMNLGYIYLPSFYADWGAMKRNDPDAKSASNDVRRLVEKLKKESDIRGLIIDLRGNGGGSLEESIDLTGLFIPSGPVVQVKVGRGKIRGHRDDDDGFAYDLPLVVMVDKTSASASEIFAGAIQDYGRGVLIGGKSTHGKGTVQTVLRLGRYDALSKLKPGALKYTMAKFYRVTGASTQKKGITPDIIFPSFYDFMDIGEGKLKHVLEWDEIPPNRIDNSHMNVSKYLPRIKASSAKRISDSKAMQVLFDEIKRYGARRQLKELSLNQEKRAALQKEDEYWAKRTNEILFQDRSGKKDEKKKDDGKKDEKKPEARDLYLEEALIVLGDLVKLFDDDKAK